MSKRVFVRKSNVISFPTWFSSQLTILHLLLNDFYVFISAGDRLHETLGGIGDDLRVLGDDRDAEMTGRGDQ